MLFPAFARIQDDVEKMQSVWLRVNRMVGALTIPAMVGLACVAPDLVRVVLGERWHTAIPVIRILAWVGLLQSLQSLNSSILQARDRTNTLLRFSAIALTSSLIAFVGGLHWGIIGVATGYAISSSFVEPYYTAMTARVLGVSPLRFWKNIRGIAISSAVMGAAVVGARSGLIALGTPAGLRLPALIALGAVVYGLAAFVLAPEVVAEVRELRDRRRESRTA